MSIDLDKGISLKIGGELGKFQTLSVDDLIKISETLQELIISIAKFDITGDDAVDLNNFKIELTDFKKSSAVPVFCFTKRIQTTTSDYNRQKKEVSEKLNRLFEVSDKGNYLDLKNIYPDLYKRNLYAEKLYNFNKSFKDSPVTLSEINNQNEEYKLKPFKLEVKNKIIVNIKETKIETEERNAFAYIKITSSKGKEKKKIYDIINTHQHSLSYSPDIININGKKYILKFPLRCLFEKEDDFYVIKNELLDILGTGITQDEAEQNFNEEFDFLASRLNSLPNENLSPKFQQIRDLINFYIQSILQDDIR